MECSCTTPGHCPIFNRRMVGRPYQICQGQKIAPLAREEYLAKWLAESTSPRRQPAPQPSCIHRGEETGLLPCATCHGLVLIKTFACELHGTCSARKNVGHPTCRGCGDYEATAAAEAPPLAPRTLPGVPPGPES